MTTSFDIKAPLPTGRVTLEASAGTGKTYVIVGLAVRYLAEGRCSASELLVVTFARSATRELRARLLDRLHEALQVVEAAAEGHMPGPGGDAVDIALCNGADVKELQRRRDRLRVALADIDQATISTIHAFGADMLTRLGEGHTGELLSDDDQLATEIAADLYLKAAAKNPAAVRQLPYFDLFAAELVHAGMTMEPGDIIPSADLEDFDGAKAWLAANANAEGTRRKKRAMLHTHDDLLQRLADRLAAPTGGFAGRFRVGLVDEFQDTDPVQWQILSTLFADTDLQTLVLVGDPKQAIYSFRGADINAYVTARGPQADAGLDTNRRSDSDLVKAVVALFGGQALGRHIAVPDVKAFFEARLRGLDAAPVTFCCVPDDAPVRRTKTGGMQLTSLRALVAADVAVQTGAILNSGAMLTDGGAGSTRSVRPSDITVLVRTRRQAALVQQHLIEAGIAAVVNGVGNVMTSPAARDWGHLLRALDQPSRSGPARLAALSDLIGWTPGQVAGATEADWDTLHVNLHRWKQILLDEGVAAAYRHLSTDTKVAQRLLATSGGGRRLTDLTHMAELLHAHASSQVTGTGGLLAWLEHGMAEAAAFPSPTPPDHLTSRLERDDDAVSIMTVHGAKGLEFGIVLAPYLWDTVGRTPAALRVHDPVTERMKLYVGSNRRSPDHQHYHDLHRQQTEEEERRLAYVAATRAKHHLRIWWAPAPQVADSPLGTILGSMSGAISGATPGSASNGPGQIHTTAQARQAIAGLGEAHPGLFGHLAVDPFATAAMSPAPEIEQAPLVLGRLHRPIDHGWRRSSYSRLVGDADAAADVASRGTTDVDTQPVASAGDVEDEAAALPIAHPAVVSDDPELAVEVPLGALRGGADIGTTIHAALEDLDFADPGLPADALRRLTIQSGRHGLDLGDEDARKVIADGLVQAIRTPLGADPGVALADLPRRSRLDEMAFELPVLGSAAADRAGWDQADRVLVNDISDLLQRHLPDGDPLAGYSDRLRRDLGVTEIRGYLAGFIDLVAQMPDGTYLVADYKTNRLAPAGTDPLTVGSFVLAAMAHEMQTHHYPLQALIYLVAVHRYLRWRVADYRPEQHLAGVAYLFVRGMIGPTTPVRDGMRCGVFIWRPPAALILDLDRLFSKGLDPADRVGPGSGQRGHSGGG